MSHGWKNITSLLWEKFGNIRTSVMPLVDFSRLHCKLYKTFLWLMGSVTPEKLLTASSAWKYVSIICFYEDPMQLLLELNLWKPIRRAIRASLIAELVKNLPAVQKTCVRSLVWEDLLEKGKAPHSSILAWRIPEVTKNQTRLSNFHTFHSGDQIRLVS